MAECDKGRDRLLREALAGEGKSVLRAQFPVAEMPEDVQGALGVLMQGMIERTGFEPVRYGGGRKPSLALDDLLAEKIEPHAPKCNAENCCRSVGMNAAYYGEAARTVLSVTCTYDTPADTEEAMRREGRCKRIQGRTEKAFGNYVTSAAAEIRDAQARIQSAEGEIEYQNGQLDALLT